MAKVCGAIVGYFILFLFYLTDCKSPEIEHDLEYNKYEIIPNLPQLHADHYLVNLRQKRQTPSTEYKEVTDSSVPKPESTTSNLQQFYPNAPNNNKTLEQTKQEPPGTTKDGGSTPIPQSVMNNNNPTPTPSKSEPVVKDQPLLGVNGTGQRKDQLNNSQSTTISKPIPALKSTTATPIVSEPINLTPTATILSPKKNGETTQQQVVALDQEEIIENIDTPDNDTNKDILTQNVSNFTEDYHMFYNSSTIIDPDLVKEYWNTIKDIDINDVLSRSHRRAMTIQLKFDFPFYGHLVKSITVATGGFLYTGEFVHSWLAATQYIAPLMANFDTSISNDSFVRYSDNGTAFTVVWENVSLQDKPDVGTFTFSTTLFNTGDIVFTYYSVPIQIEAIHDDKHPVKVGLSDAYIMDKVVFFARRKTIYEYHRVNFAGEDIKNSTIIYLTALPTCLKFQDCVSCLTELSTFKCSWCPNQNKCSTGSDRKRQDWIQQGCDKTQITDKLMCPAIGEKGNNAAQQIKYSTDGTVVNNTDWQHNESNDTPVIRMQNNENTVIRTFDKSKMESSKKEEEKSNVGLVLGFMLPICLIMSALVWVLYAYRNPHTKSGQLLIQYRPSQWTWRRGEARYTAATIHM